MFEVEGVPVKCLHQDNGGIAAHRNVIDSRALYFLNQFTFHCRAHNSARLASSARLSFSSFSSSSWCWVTILLPRMGDIISGHPLEVPGHQVLDELPEGGERAVPLLLPVLVPDDSLSVTEGVPGGHVGGVSHVEFVLEEKEL